MGTWVCWAQRKGMGASGVLVLVGVSAILSTTRPSHYPSTGLWVGSLYTPTSQMGRVRQREGH